MIHVWDSSLAGMEIEEEIQKEIEIEMEKESNRRDNAQSEKERWSGSTAVNCNDDDWSDSSDIEGDNLVSVPLKDPSCRL